MMSHVVHARRDSGGRENPGCPAQVPETPAESVPGVGLVRLLAVGQQWRARGVPEAQPPLEVGGQFPPRIAGERNDAGLAELRHAHEQSGPRAVMVTDAEPHPVPTSQGSPSRACMGQAASLPGAARAEGRAPWRGTRRAPPSRRPPASSHPFQH